MRRSYDRTIGRIRQTKTGNKGMRRFAVEPELLPLLRAMHAAANGQGAVVNMRQQKWWAADLREHLELAGITLEALFATGRHAQAPALPRPARDGPNLDGHSRR